MVCPDISYQLPDSKMQSYCSWEHFHFWSLLMRANTRDHSPTEAIERDAILAEVHRRIAEHRNGHFHRSADGYSDPDSVVDALEDLASWITALQLKPAKSAA
jgi:hypothetical protein